MEYVPKTSPRLHQKQFMDNHKDAKAYAWRWYQGTGKTYTALNNICYLWMTGAIEAALVVAPNGVHINWVDTEIPKHMHPDFDGETDILVWDSKKAGNKGAKKRAEELLSSKAKMPMLFFSYNAIVTKAGSAYANKFLKKYKCIMILDESHKIKGRGVTARVCCRLGKKAVVRRVLTGSMISQGPFDCYAQIQFLDPDFWKVRNLYPYVVFKNYFGVWEDPAAFLKENGYALPYPMLHGYRNMDKLKPMLNDIGKTVSLTDTGVVLPPKVYTKRYFHLTPKVRKVYDNLRNDNIAVLPETGDWVETEGALALLTRLQQVCCGYVATEAGEPVQVIDTGKNPRLELLWENLEESEGKAIIWAKFTADIDSILKMLESKGKKVVRYDGLVSSDDKVDAKRSFQDGDADYFVGKEQSGAEGLTLHSAHSMHYYNNTYSHVQRVQSEARAYRLGLMHTMLYVDYLAINTIETRIIDNLVKKDVLSRDLLSLPERDWLK